MQNAQNFKRVTVSAGKYYLGDPCYSVPSKFWSDLLDSADFFEVKSEGKVNGYTVYAMSTKYGDGVYRCNRGYSYPVDSGLIGLVPVEFGQKINDVYPDCDLVQVITFDKDTECSYSDGLMKFGSISIETGDPDDSEDFDDEEELDEDF